MTKLHWPSKTNRDNFLNATLETIGRPVDFYYVVSTSGCSVCSLDPVTNTSTDAFCDVCSGAYWLETLASSGILSHVTWKFSEDLSWHSAGQQMVGDCQVRINYTPDTVAIVDSIRYLVVDERVMQVNKVDMRGSPEVNRIIISLMEKEKSNE